MYFYVRDKTGKQRKVSKLCMLKVREVVLNNGAGLWILKVCLDFSCFHVSIFAYLISGASSKYCLPLILLKDGHHSSLHFNTTHDSELLHYSYYSSTEICFLKSSVNFELGILIVLIHFDISVIYSYFHF